MSALGDLVQKVRQARELGLLPAEWGTLAEAALAENTSIWESERVFRVRTGSGERWCQRNFVRCQAVGLARRGGKGKREWHIHARLPRGTAGAIVQQIQESHRGAA